MLPEPDAERTRNGRSGAPLIASAPRSGAPLIASARVPVDASLCREIEALIPRLRRYARALKRDPVAADDLVQDCLCRALAKLHLWEKGTDLRAWLFTILHHQHCSDVRRSVRQGARAPITDLRAVPAAGADATSRLQLRDLERAIAGLPAAQRQVILLIGLEGLCYEKVAAIVGIPLGTVRSRVARARETLRRMMDPAQEAAKPAPTGHARRPTPRALEREAAA